ncbi:LysR family transcriptional regulator [Spartinivicinus poritis]|uniref:LysR family transcriptional regulator n=1 Tax=Spartinivicinus poritis TaxID=2994640 RepID=A0ABT5U7U5_9GAMM|nr:LysR family transcriptional regulator [Spartinivicinus sp. A2-2]MDE1462440.1 LysR family transcriptional regulator [Spartinivicinus sp. A2-2]
MFDDIALFIHIVQQGGLSGAASYLSLPAATVTRRLKKLEQQLGCQLLHRSARQCVLTQEGEVYYQAYAELVEQFEQAQQQLSKDLKQLSGKLKILAPTNISHGFLRQMWLGFTRTYPKIQLELILSNQLQDMIKNKADIAIRIGPQADSSLYQLKLGQIDKIMVASPDFLTTAGEPQHPSEVKTYRVIGTTLFSKWTLSHIESGETQEIFPRFNAIFNDTSFVKYMVCDSQGISLLPLTEVKSELDSGQLVRILPQWRGEVREIYAVWPSGRLLSEKAKCLRTYLKEYIKTHLV